MPNTTKSASLHTNIDFMIQYFGCEHVSGTEFVTIREKEAGRKIISQFLHLNDF